MNLELLDPFGRQVPDRLDANLSIPTSCHFRHHPWIAGNSEKAKGISVAQDWKAAYCVAFNRRGTYLAVGYGSSTVAVYDTLSRSVTSLYQSDEQSLSPKRTEYGITQVSWSRRSRSLLTGALQDARVQLYDCEHRYGPENCSLRLAASQQMRESEGRKKSESSMELGSVLSVARGDIGYSVEGQDVEVVDEKRPLSCRVVAMGERIDGPTTPLTTVTTIRTKRRYPYVQFTLPEPVAGSLHVNPRVPTAGLAVLQNGSLVVFYVPPEAFTSANDLLLDSDEVTVVVMSTANITCASFDPHGERIFAATKKGHLLGFQVDHFFTELIKGSRSAEPIPTIEPHFKVHMGSSTAAWHLVVARNNKYLIVNLADGAIRLFSIHDIWKKQGGPPIWAFQDKVSKVKFASCDLSGDGEYVVAGTNGGDHKYQLYVWNTGTGTLADKLTGASVTLFSVAWHPSRAFIAVATSDGLVDMWGPRINWTAFAPDFQALPQNVEYIEREDEFDVDKEGNYLVDQSTTSNTDNESRPVDVLTVNKVPVFDSDSEDEEDIFIFNIAVKASR